MSANTMIDGRTKKPKRSDSHHAAHTSQRVLVQYSKHRTLLQAGLEKLFLKSGKSIAKGSLNLKELKQIDESIKAQIDKTLRNYLPKVEADLQFTLKNDARQFVKARQLNLKELKHIDNNIQQKVDATVRSILPRVKANLSQTLKNDARRFVCSIANTQD